MDFVQPQDTMRHLGILLSACDQKEATGKMCAMRLIQPHGTINSAFRRPSFAAGASLT